MDRFFKIMYDFFAFAFPGACIVVTVLLLHNDDGQLLYKSLPKVFRINIWETYIAITLLGYLAGYIIKPLARFVLLRFLTIRLFYIIICRNIPWLRRQEVAKFEKLYNFLFHKKDYSKIFIRIRERTRVAYQYIEFWDMHITMSHNLAAACLIFIALHLPSTEFGSMFSLQSPTIIAVWIALIAFPVLLNRSVYYAFWWMSDIKAAKRFKYPKPIEYKSR